MYSSSPFDYLILESTPTALTHTNHTLLHSQFLQEPPHDLQLEGTASSFRFPEDLYERDGTNSTLFSYLCTCVLEKVLLLTTTAINSWTCLPNPQRILEFLLEQL